MSEQTPGGAKGRLDALVGPAADKPTKAELIHRRRGEVCALGRLIRALDKEPSCNARTVAKKHYSKAMRILKETHQRPNNTLSRSCKND